MKPDPLDRRQRQAAAILLAAVDLPMPVADWAQLGIAAAKVCPGITATEGGVGLGRRAALRLARDLIDEMLAEPETQA